LFGLTKTFACIINVKSFHTHQLYTEHIVGATRWAGHFPCRIRCIQTFCPLSHNLYRKD